ncbi:metallophosphoesterase [Bengtsoniella intestinalis]|uniref:metallophosphoesterase n=1 Tax=Bengtsoniella intestinalis TaxID=3073143 RepID=UPI00391F2E40
MTPIARYRGRSRWKKWLVLPLVLVAIAAFGYWSNHTIEITRTTVELETLPHGFEGMDIVVIGDTQAAEFGQDNARLIQAVADQNPAYIFFVGDLVDRDHPYDEAYVTALALGLVDVAPTYYITGNHEWALGDVEGLKSVLADCGVTVLSNEYVTLEANGDTLVLAGIDDPLGYADQKTPEELAAEINALNPNCWVLLAHRNDYFETQYSLLGADLVVSGHGHGGLIRLPFTDGLIDHSGLLPSYTAGLYELNGSTLFATRGLGNSKNTFRLFNRSEVAVITLTQ